MEQNHWSRSTISGIVGVAAVVLVYWTFPPIKNLPQGIFLPEQVVRAPSNSKDVQTLPESPLTAQPVGAVHVLLHIEGEPTQAEEDSVLNKAQELAASGGANGMVKRYAGPVSSGPFRSLALQASAIYVPAGGV